MARGPRRGGNRRGSPEAVAKRRAARRFNDLLGGSAARPGLDGRTEKRRLRLLGELKEGLVRATRAPLKPIDVLSRVHALLAMGEPLASIKRACKPPRPVQPTAALVAGLRTLQAAYSFPPEAYQFVGIDAATLARALGAAKPGLRSARRGGSRKAA